LSSQTKSSERGQPIKYISACSIAHQYRRQREGMNMIIIFLAAQQPGDGNNSDMHKIREANAKASSAQPKIDWSGLGILFLSKIIFVSAGPEICVAEFGEGADLSITILAITGEA
jgi:hypothetical protein